LLVLPLLAAIALAACGGAPDEDATATPGMTDPVTVEPTTGSATTEPPAATEDPGPTGSPTDEPSVEPTATGGPSPTADAGGPAADCAGSDENRDFYAAVAAAVTWPVYCPTLGDGWFVDTGQYRLAGGGRLEIGYRGPEGARIELREGYVCADATCVPSGEDLGGAAFGDRAGTLVGLGDGAYAVVAEGDGDARWFLETTGLAEDDVRTIAAGLIRVEG
jgi:hypothetical protein